MHALPTHTRNSIDQQLGRLVRNRTGVSQPKVPFREKSGPRVQDEILFFYERDGTGGSSSLSPLPKEILDPHTHTRVQLGRCLGVWLGYGGSLNRVTRSPCCSSHANRSVPRDQQDGNISVALVLAGPARTRSYVSTKTNFLPLKVCNFEEIFADVFWMCMMRREVGRWT